MFKQLKLIIDQDEKVQIKYNNTFFYIKKQELFNKIENLYKETGDAELNFILGTIISIKAMSLKNGKIECFYNNKNFWAKRPEAIIEESVDLYNLLRGLNKFK